MTARIGFVLIFYTFWEAMYFEHEENETLDWGHFKAACSLFEKCH